MMAVNNTYAGVRTAAGLKCVPPGSPGAVEILWDRVRVWQIRGNAETVATRFRSQPSIPPCGPSRGTCCALHAQHGAELTTKLNLTIIHPLLFLSFSLSLSNRHTFSHDRKPKKEEKKTTKKQQYKQKQVICLAEPPS